MKRSIAVIAGASGLIGRRLADHLLATGDWDVIGLSRHPRSTPSVRWIAVELSSRDDCENKLGILSEVTHIFYAARFDFRQGAKELIDINAGMLRNLVEVLDSVAELKHVHAVHGGKYYGVDVGPVPPPMREEITPRTSEANFYFAQEDFLREYSRGKTWGYTTSRPHAFCDPAPDYPRSIGLAIAVYATIQRELGTTLDFPGTALAYGSRREFTDLGLLARAIGWMTQEPRCRNQSFNLVNGDDPKWSDLWPRFAFWFGLEAGPPGKLKLTAYMADKGVLWNMITHRQGLRSTRLDELVSWPYADHNFGAEWDVCYSMSKGREFGFSENVDSASMFIRQFENYQNEKVIPR